MPIIVCTINVTSDEGTFLATVLERNIEAAPMGSAERFWLERMHNRIQTAVMDVVAADASARLAASSSPVGFPFPGVPGPPGPPPPPAPPAAVQMCACGNPLHSAACVRRSNQGTHP